MLQSDEEKSDGQDEAPSPDNGLALADDDTKPAPSPTRHVKHKLHATTSNIKHHKSLSTNTTATSSSPQPPPPPPSTSLTPASSTTALIHQLATNINQLHTTSLTTITTLRNTSPTPSLLPTYKAELDAYQAEFSSAAVDLATPIIPQLCTNYTDRLEGVGDECRSLSWRVSQSLSQVSSSAAGTASERIHAVYASYRSLQTEYDNSLLLAAVASQLHALITRLSLVKLLVKEQAWMKAVDELAAVRRGVEQLVALDPHMAASVVYRRLMVTPHSQTNVHVERERVMTQKADLDHCNTLATLFFILPMRVLCTLTSLTWWSARGEWCMQLRCRHQAKVMLSFLITVSISVAMPQFTDLLCSFRLLCAPG